MILLTVFDVPLTRKTTAHIYYYEADSTLSTIKILLLVLIRSRRLSGRITKFAVARHRAAPYIYFRGCLKP